MKRIFCLLTLALALTACGREEEAHQTLTLNIQTEPMSLNPGIGGERRSQVVLNLLYEGLFRKGPDGLQGGMAEAYEVDESQTRYTFRLREAKWSDGTPVTAQDFVHSWQAVVSPESESFYGYAFYPILNAQKIKLKQEPLDALGVRALNERTLQVDLEHPAPYFLELLANPVYAPFNQIHPEVYNGPYRLLEWKKGAGLRLLKNESYWDAVTVKLNEIQIHVIPDAHTNLASYEAGEVDFCGPPLCELPQAALPSLKESGELRSHPIAGVFWFEFNHQHFPLNHPKIRRAFSLALDRQAIVEHVLYGEGSPLETVLPPQLALNAFDEENPELARRLLREGMEELGLEEFPALTLSYGDMEGQKVLAQTVQGQWKDTLGVTVLLRGEEWNSYLSNVFRRNYEIGGILWYSWFDDPIYNLQAFKDPDDWMNVSGWEDVSYTALLDASDKEADPVKRRELLTQAEARLVEAAAVAPVYALTYSYLQRSDLKGVFISELGLIDFKWAYKD